MIGDIILAVALILMSAVWTYIGIFDLGIWIPGVSAGSGFIPTLFGLLTMVCCIIMLVQNLKKHKNAPKTGKSAKATDSSDTKARVLAFVKKYSPIFFGIFGVLCLVYLGLIPMAFLIILGWMKLMNNFPWAKSVAIAAAVTVVIYLIFDMWLQIPLGS